MKIYKWWWWYLKDEEIQKKVHISLNSSTKFVQVQILRQPNQHKFKFADLFLHYKLKVSKFKFFINQICSSLNSPAFLHYKFREVKFKFFIDQISLSSNSPTFCITSLRYTSLNSLTALKDQITARIHTFKLGQLFASQKALQDRILELVSVQRFRLHKGQKSRCWEWC